MRRSAELSEAALARIEALMPLTCINCKGASLVEPESTVFGDSAEVTGEDVRRSAARRVHRAIPACHRRAVTARGLHAGRARQRLVTDGSGWLVSAVVPLILFR